MAPRRKRTIAAFTLIELLVVVSIIAMLISILLPSLQAAREQAKTVSCQANVAGLAKACATYGTEHNAWLPGSPGTTGGELLGTLGSLGATAEVYPAGSGKWKPHAVSIWDWAGPLASVQMKAPLSGTRPEKFRRLAEGVFACPSNKVMALPFFGSAAGAHGGFDVQRMISYNSVRNFYYWPPKGARAPFSEASQVPGGTYTWPTRLLPQLERLGTPSQKVFLADGSRYTQVGTGVDFDISWRANYGGAFSDGGPTLPEVYMRSYLINDPERRYAYRHGRKTSPGIVASFFDGHGAYLSERESRIPDYWWPKGTIIPRLELNKQSLFTVPPGAWVNNAYAVRQ